MGMISHGLGCDTNESTLMRHQENRRAEMAFRVAGRLTRKEISAHRPSRKGKTTQKGLS